MKTYITETIEKFRLLWGLAPKGSLKYSKGSEIERFIIHELEKVAKMFGGCTKCYGKGYGTTTNQYSEGDGFRKWTEQEMDFCSCDRGKQLEQLGGKR